MFQPLMITGEEIIAQLPYGKSFLFVDRIMEISEEHIVGGYTFSPQASFYESHFVNNPVTPGVILTECMAQIGLACFGMYLISKDRQLQDIGIAMSENHVIYNKPVYPGEVVSVFAKKIYFRMQKLKCSVSMKNVRGEEVCRGELSGVILPRNAG